MKLNILTVERDVAVLSYLEELLSKLKVEGKLYFTKSNEEAISIMKQSDVNILISDIKNPQINEDDFLDFVKEEFPAIIRIALFDKSNHIELLLKSVVSAHKCISKPIDSEIFNKIILEILNQNTLLVDENLRAVINKIDSFPSLPRTYLEIEEELSKESFSIKKISDIVHKDMAIATRIIQVVNSPLFGLAKNITDIQQAISILGITMVKSLILYTQIFKSFEGNMRVESIQKEIWEHSLKVAKISKLLIANFGNRNEIETGYISGLLHDIGKVIIINNEAYIYEILEIMKSENTDYNDSEKRVLGVTHAEVGAYLLSLWGLPNVIVNSVKNHHKISRIDNNILNIQTSVFIANEYNTNSKINQELLLNNGFEKIIPQILSILV